MGLSHVLILFYAFCWISTRPLRSLPQLAIFYCMFSLSSCIWWGGYGTWQLSRATTSGYDSCLATSPTLYLLSAFQVVTFWLCFLIACGFCAREIRNSRRQKTEKMVALAIESAKNSDSATEQEEIYQTKTVQNEVTPNSDPPSQESESST